MPMVIAQRERGIAAVHRADPSKTEEPALSQVERVASVVISRCAQNELRSANLFPCSSRSILR